MRRILCVFTLVFVFCSLQLHADAGLKQTENITKTHLYQDYKFQLSDPIELRIKAPLAEELKLEMRNPENPQETYKKIVLNSTGQTANGEFIYLLSTAQIEAFYKSLHQDNSYRLQLKISSDSPLLNLLVYQKIYGKKQLIPAG